MTDDSDGWTDRTLRIYIDTRIEHLHQLLSDAESLTSQRFTDQDRAVLAALAAQEKAIGAALAAAERAVGKSELAAEKRFDAVNEFRAQLADQATTFIPRAEAEQRMAANAEKIDALATRIDRTEGHSGGMNAGWAILAGVTLVITSVISIIITLTHK